MKVFIRNYKAEMYQFLHSKLLIVHLAIPMIGILLFVSYYSCTSWGNIDKIRAYLQVVAMAFPALIAIVMGMASEAERNAAHFQRILTAPHSKKRIHLSKLLVIGTWGFLSVIITVIGFGALTLLMGNDAIKLMDYFKLAIILFVAHIGWYIIEYIVSFMWSPGIGLGLGIMGSLLSPLMSFDLGDPIWPMIPCAWGMRLVGYTLAMMTNSKRQLLDALCQKKSMYMVLISLFIFIVFIIWSEKWQGIARQEE